MEKVFQLYERLLYPKKEAAYLAGISIRALDYHIAVGRIKVRHKGKNVLIPRSELLKFVARDDPGRPLSASEIARKQRSGARSKREAAPSEEGSHGNES